MRYIRIDVFCKLYSRNITCYVYYHKDDDNNTHFIPTGCEEYHSSEICEECKMKTLYTAKDLFLTNPEYFFFN